MKNLSAQGLLLLAMFSSKAHSAPACLQPQACTFLDNSRKKPKQIASLEIDSGKTGLFNYTDKTSFQTFISDTVAACMVRNEKATCPSCEGSCCEPGKVFRSCGIDLKKEEDSLGKVSSELSVTEPYPLTSGLTCSQLKELFNKREKDNVTKADVSKIEIWGREMLQTIARTQKVSSGAEEWNCFASRTKNDKKKGAVIESFLTVGSYNVAISEPVCEGEKVIIGPRAKIKLKCPKSEEEITDSGVKASIHLTFEKVCNECLSGDESKNSNH